MVSYWYTSLCAPMHIKGSFGLLFLNMRKLCLSQVFFGRIASHISISECQANLQLHFGRFHFLTE